MTPALPPSSSTTFFLPARSFIRQPTDGEPVKVSSLKRGSATIRSPSSRVIGRIETEPAGTPADSMISATVSIVSGSLDGGFRTMGLPEAMAGRELVGGQVEREVERADGRDRADREAPGDADAILRRRHQVERDELAGHPLRLLGPEAEGQRRPVHLDQRVADRLARLEGDQSAELLAAGLDAGADLAQDPAAFVGGQVAGHLEGGHGRRDGLLVLRLGRVVGRAGGRAGIGRIVDDEDVGRVDPAAGEVDLVRLGRGDDGHRCGAPFGYGWHRTTGSRATCCDEVNREPTDRPARRPPGQARFTHPTGEGRPPIHVRARQGDVGRGDREADGAPARAAGSAMGRGEAFGPRRPAGHRRGRQGRHHRQGHGGVQPAGLPGHVVQGADPRGTRPRLPVAGPQARRPARARSAIFNRSHYEDVLVVRVHGLVPKSVWSKRYDQINDFERTLAAGGTTIVKFFLSIDKDEQRKRFQARYDDPTKRWKFSTGDLEERKHWDDYQRAFDDMLTQDVDRPGAVVRHPGQPELVPQPRGLDHPGRHDGRPEAGLPDAAGPAPEPGHRVVGAALPPPRSLDATARSRRRCSGPGRRHAGRCPRSNRWWR